LNPTALIQAKGTTATTSRATNSVDAGGAVIQTFAQNLTGVKVFPQPMSASEIVKYGREAHEPLFKAFVEPNKDIIQRDRMTIGSTVYDVEGPLPWTLGGTEQFEVMVIRQLDTV
jgi:hypothetical protein